MHAELAALLLCCCVCLHTRADQCQAYVPLSRQSYLPSSNTAYFVQPHMHQLHSVAMKPALAPGSSLLSCAVAEVNACSVAGEIEEP